jgi:hypothetical protein
VGSTITNDARCARAIISRIAMPEAAFNEVTLFTSRMDLNLRNKLAKRYIWSTVLRRGEYWTLRKIRKKYTEISEI